MTNESMIHPSSVIEDGAKLGERVKIGPFCYVSAESALGDDVELISHVSVLGATTLGAGSQVYPNAVLGGAPQNLKHQGGRTTLTIGRGCVIREGVTLHRGTDTSRGATTIGDNCLFMAYSHVAHDCIVGNNVSMANYACLGGHVELGDNVIMSGYAAVHQFARVGHHAFLAAFAAVSGDVIPYGMAIGDRAELRGLNVVGMKRAGMARSELMRVRQAYQLIFSQENSLAENMEQARREFGESAAVAEILEFIASRERRYLTLPAQNDHAQPNDDATK